MLVGVTQMPPDTAELVGVAARVLDDAAAEFVAGLGAAPRVFKSGPVDFATDVDLSLERRITERLRTETGLPVHGEEYGGPGVDAGTVWVLDPIDGSANYSAGLPMSGILLALVHEGDVVAGSAWFPVFGRRLHAMAGGPLFDGDTELPALAPVALRTATVALGSIRTAARGRFPGTFRIAVVDAVSRGSARVRAIGSTGFDLGAVASGGYAGAFSYGRNPWDNAAGACLVRAAGGIVTDLAGRHWGLHSDSILAAAPGAHAELVEIIAAAAASTGTTL